MTIKYYTKNVYGRETMYIVDKKQAEAIAIITGLKTLSISHKKALETLGHKFEEVLQAKQ